VPAASFPKTSVTGRFPATSEACRPRIYSAKCSIGFVIRVAEVVQRWFTLVVDRVNPGRRIDAGGTGGRGNTLKAGMTSVTDCSVITVPATCSTYASAGCQWCDNAWGCMATGNGQFECPLRKNCPSGLENVETAHHESVSTGSDLLCCCRHGRDAIFIQHYVSKTPTNVLFSANCVWLRRMCLVVVVFGKVSSWHCHRVGTLFWCVLSRLSYVVELAD